MNKQTTLEHTYLLRNGLQQFNQAFDRLVDSKTKSKYRSSIKSWPNGDGRIGGGSGS